MAAAGEVGAALERELEWARLQLAAAAEAQAEREGVWRRERAQLLNRIQAPQAAVGEAWAEADAERRTQEPGEPRRTREVNWDSEDLRAREEHLEQARRELAKRGLTIDGDEVVPLGGHGS